LGDGDGRKARTWRSAGSWRRFFYGPSDRLRYRGIANLPLPLQALSVSKKKWAAHAPNRKRRTYQLQRAPKPPQNPKPHPRRPPHSSKKRRSFWRRVSTPSRRVSPGASSRACRRTRRRVSYWAYATSRRERSRRRKPCVLTVSYDAFQTDRHIGIPLTYPTTSRCAQSAPSFRISVSCTIERGQPTCCARILPIRDRRPRRAVEGESPGAGERCCRY
jgi:hypothetical protein